MINKAILVGRLGKDPELKYTPSGVAVANFSIATTKTWKSDAGEKQERTDWHNIVVWRKLAEVCGEWLKKGDLIYIEGEIQTRSYEKDGVKRYVTEIVANEMKMLGGKPKQQEEQPSQPASPEAPKEDDLPF